MKKHDAKRLLALLLTICMSLGMIGTVYATEATSDGGATVTWEKMTEGSLMEGVETNAEVVPEKAESKFADDEMVRVFVVLSKKSVLQAGYSTKDLAANEAALQYAEKIESEQTAVIDRITEEVLGGKELKVNYQFSLVTNAFSATVEYGQINEIAAVDGVEDVYLVPVYELMEEADPNTMTAGEMVGSYQTWSNGYTGAGTRIAVIDTGLDVDHPSFDPAALMVSLAESAAKADTTVAEYDLLNEYDIFQVLENLNAFERYSNLTAEDLYYNEKVPFGFNYIDYNLDVTHDNDSQGDHGTHVSGIAAANKYVQTVHEDGRISWDSQEMGVVGVAPDAQVIVMKVFGAYGGAYSDDYMAAIEDAILLGADAINLSLGIGAAGFTTDTYEGTNYVEDIFDLLVGSDTIVSISAGNSYSWGEFSELGANTVWDVDLDTVGSPGSYANALTVASVNNSGYTGLVSEFENSNMINYNEYLNGYTNSPLVGLDVTEDGSGTEYEYVLIDSVGAEADYEHLDVAGKIVLVYRGETSFYEKHMVAERMGAKALFVINNTTGVINMNLADSTAVIPCVSILQAEGESIKAGAEEAAIGDLTVYTGKVTIYGKDIINYNSNVGWQMSEFSSWGVPGDLSLKPEITAPGGNIYSTLTDGQYGLMSGTSMAAPSVAGMSALVLQYIEENDLAEKTGLSARTLAQALLMGTAAPLMEGEVEYSPRRQGAGLANAAAATESPYFILVGDAEGNDGKVKAELGDDPDRTGVYSFDFTIYNMSDERQRFDFDASVLTEAVENELFIAEREYALSPDVEFVLDGMTDAPIYDFDLDGDVDVEDAAAMLAWINGTGETRLSEAELLKFDFVEDGVYDTDDVYLYLSYISGNLDGADVTDIHESSDLMLAAGESAQVTVTITLSEADRRYLDTYFTNGIYIDAFVYVEGAQEQSIPMLAFYGNWSDSSMYENWDFMSQTGYTYTYPYGYTNYLSYMPAGDTDEYYLMPNMYVTDEAYIADRTAISPVNGDKLGNFCVTPIRNMANIDVEIVDAEDGTVYYSVPNWGDAYSAYYYVNGQYWDFTSLWVDLYWNGTDLEGNMLPDETRTLVRMTAVPEYYVKNEGKELGNGVSIEIPVAIDNTAPEATNIAAVVENDDIVVLDITVTDNRYVAAVYLFNSAGEVLGSYAVNQEEYAAETTLTADVSAIDRDVIYVAVIDYAGNETDYRAKISFVPDTEIAEDIELSHESVRILKGMSAQLEATVYPLDLLLVKGVTWTSADETIATVDENGVVTGHAVGATTITATTEAEPYLTATCEVEIFELPGADLKGFISDDWNGNMMVSTAYWAEFNTNAVDETVRTSELLTPEYFAATVVGDKIVAGTRTHQMITGYSDIYVIDPADGYAEELKYEKVRWLTDMTYMPNLDGGVVAGSYAYNLNLLDMETGVVLTLNLSDLIGKDYMLGVAYAYSQYDEESAVDVDYFYTVTWTGKVYLIGLASDPSTDLSYFVYFDETSLLTGIDFNSNSVWYFNSLYYDRASGYLFWSALDNDAFWDPAVSGNLYAINSATGEHYDLGDFPADVLAVSGLFRESDLTEESLIHTEAVNSTAPARAQSIQAVPVEEAEEIPIPELPQTMAE